MGHNAVVDEMKGPFILIKSLFFLKAAGLLTNVLKGEKFSEGDEKILRISLDFLRDLVGGIILIEGGANTAEFPISSKGRENAFYFYAVIEKEKLIDRGLIRLPFSGYLKGFYYTLKRLMDFVGIFNDDDRKKIEQLRTFFEFLREKIRWEAQAVSNTEDQDD